MALNQDQNGGMEPDQSHSGESRGETSSVDQSRRRFTKSGLAASGVILTLSSRPVMGAGDGPMACKSPSGWISGNSSTHGQPPTCMGRSPGYWQNHEGNWPIPRETRFRDVFADCRPGSVYYDTTMYQLCTAQQYDKYKLGRHLTSAYLNAVKGWTPFLPVATIRAMFTEWQEKGYFSPTAGVKWYPDQIVEYLTATQG